MESNQEDCAAEDSRVVCGKLEVARLTFPERRQRLKNAGHESWRRFLACAMRLAGSP
jgi:hypothetical protein